ncbi:MAG: MarR family transcriptional regulator [Proteobacteria bacterium]|nr:MarR family transcriptional regulator [Pseudomonadota bacterium]
MMLWAWDPLIDPEDDNSDGFAFRSLTVSVSRLFYSYMKRTSVLRGSGEKDRQLMFSVINAGRAIEQRLEDALAKVGLSLAKFMALTHLVEAGEPLSLSEFAKKMACVRSNITQLMDRLEADGLVLRVKDPQDRRAVRAVVTPIGAERQVQGAKEMARVQTELAGTLSGMDHSTLQRALSAIK